MGAAMRCMTSLPVPLLSMMGISPAIVATAVITTGRSRRSAPSRTAAIRADSPASPLAWWARSAWFR